MAASVADGAAHPDPLPASGERGTRERRRDDVGGEGASEPVGSAEVPGAIERGEIRTREA